jgi:hypothetical protein
MIDDKAALAGKLNRRAIASVDFAHFEDSLVQYYRVKEISTAVKGPCIYQFQSRG